METSLGRAGIKTSMLRSQQFSSICPQDSKWVTPWACSNSETGQNQINVRFVFVFEEKVKETSEETGKSILSREMFLRTAWIYFVSLSVSQIEMHCQNDFSSSYSAQPIASQFVVLKGSFTHLSSYAKRRLYEVQVSFWAGVSVDFYSIGLIDYLRCGSFIWDARYLQCYQQLEEISVQVLVV